LRNFRKNKNKKTKQFENHLLRFFNYYICKNKNDMFGIGAGELVFIMIIVLMLFGSDKIPDIARTLGKGMAQLKHATNEIKSEIKKGAQENGLDTNSLAGGIQEEIDKAKNAVTNSLNPVEFENPVTEIKEDLESLSGPIKRQ
jgi:sec-independent protein translocase protein TatA